MQKQIILGATRAGENADNSLVESNGNTIVASELKPYPKDSNNEVMNYMLVLNKEGNSEN